MSKWNYNGDDNLKEGGWFWKVSDCKNYYDVVDVVPETNMGGADNVFLINYGPIWVPESEKLDKALASCGYQKTSDNAEVFEIVDSLLFYYGIETEISDVIRIGKTDIYSQQTTYKDSQITQVRANTNLRNYVKKRFFNILY